jgi:hypothetical protein
MAEPITDAGAVALILDSLHLIRAKDTFEEHAPMNKLADEASRLLNPYGITGGDERVGGQTIWFFNAHQTNRRVVLAIGPSDGLKVWDGPRNVTIAELKDITDRPNLSFDPVSKTFLGPVVGRDLTKEGAPYVRTTALEELVRFIIEHLKPRA